MKLSNLFSSSRGRQTKISEQNAPLLMRSGSVSSSQSSSRSSSPVRLPSMHPSSSQPVLSKDMPFDEQVKAFEAKVMNVLNADPSLNKGNLFKEEMVKLYLDAVQELKYQPEIAFDAINDDEFIAGRLEEFKKQAKSMATADKANKAAFAMNLGVLASLPLTVGLSVPVVAVVAPPSFAANVSLFYTHVKGRKLSRELAKETLQQNRHLGVTGDTEESTLLPTLKGIK